MPVILPDPRLEAPGLLYPGRKPVGPVAINWDHPLADGLVGCWLGGDLRNYADNAVGELIGTDIGTEITQGGSGWVNTGAGSTSRLSYGTQPVGAPITLAGQTKASFFFLATLDQRVLNNTFPNLINYADGGAGANGYAWHWDDNNTRFSFKLNGVDDLRDTTQAHPSTPTVSSRAVALDLDVGNAEFYRDGTWTQQANPTSPTFPSNSLELKLFNISHSTGQEWAYPLHILCIWSGRYITGPEQNRMHRDPYQFLVPA